MDPVVSSFLSAIVVIVAALSIFVVAIGLFVHLIAGKVTKESTLAVLIYWSIAIIVMAGGTSTLFILLISDFIGL